MPHISFNNSKQPADVLENQIALGKKLREARKLQKIDLQTVCNSLKIRRFFLESIENGRFDQLPGTVYTMGFVKSYAQYLGLDVGAELEQIISLCHENSTKTPERSYLLQKNKSFIPISVVILSFVFVAAFVGGAIFFKNTNMNKGPSSFIKSVEPAKDGALLSEDIFKIPQPSAPHLLQISAVRQTWIKITDADRKLLVARLLRPGETYEIEPQKGYCLTTADGGALLFSVNGTSFSLPKSDDGNLIEDMPIDIASLQAMAISKEPKEE